MNSIRRKLLVALLAAMSAVLLLAAFATYQVSEAQANALFDEQLRQIGLSMRDPLFFATLPAPIGGEEGSDYVIQVWSSEGETLYYSHPHRLLPDRAQLGFATVATPAGAWRVFALQQRGQTIQVAQPMEVRSRRAAAAALDTLTPFIVSLPVLGLLIWFIVGRGLRPLERVARSVKARTALSLAPLDSGDAPREIRSLVDALNDLLARLQAALDTQRAFIADAAHELRTPLAALQLQVQLAERATDGDERGAAMAAVTAGLRRTAHAVQQLLSLARSEAASADRVLEPVALREAVRAVVIDHQPLAAAKRIDLGMVDSGAVPTIWGDTEGLRTLLANLVGNALRYTPEGGRVDVSAGIDGDRPCLWVDDSGPGIPPAERERVFDRFYRRPGEAESGSGLGLAIVKAVALRHGAQMVLESAPAGGLRALVRFPARSVAPADGTNDKEPRKSWTRPDCSTASSAGAY